MPPPPKMSLASRARFSLLNFLSLLHLCKKPIHKAPPQKNRLTPAERARNLEGEVFGSYKLISQLDKGTFGAVYYCKHLETKQSYAIKFYSLEWIRFGEGMDTIDKELHIMKLLDHRNTVFLKDVIFTKYGILIVMELVRGRTLLDILPTADGLMEPFGRQIFDQFLDGLEYLHQKRIIHRDIKLENVMIDFEGNVKLIDYGLAEKIPRNKHPEDALLVDGECGSMNYYAPEVISSNGSPFRGDLADIWASGVLLFTMVTGTFPFDQVENAVTKSQVADCEHWVDCWARSDRSVSSELKDIIRKIFVKDPSKRPTIADLRNHPWTKGTKLPSKKYRLRVVGREVRRSVSCDLRPSTSADSTSKKGAPSNGASGDRRCSSAPHICSHEARDEIVKKPRGSNSTSESRDSVAEGRCKKVRDVLRNLWEIPARLCGKAKSKDARKTDKPNRSKGAGKSGNSGVDGYGERRKSRRGSLRMKTIFPRA